MEVAGIVLAVYPILVLMLEEYKSGAKYYRKWARFRQRHHNFVSQMELQQLLLEGLMQDLLCNGPEPFLLQVSSEKVFLEKFKDIPWDSPNLERSLKARLGDSAYRVCIDHIQRISKILQGMKEAIEKSVVCTYNIQGCVYL